MLDEARLWRRAEHAGFTLHYRGRHTVIERAVDAYMAGGSARLATSLESANGHFAGIAVGPGAVLAMTDHCRSTPIFHADGIVGNDARMVQAAAGRTAIDELSALEASMSGFTAGPHTLFDGLQQLEAGHAAIWQQGRALQKVRYFSYRPHHANTASSEHLCRQLDIVLNEVFGRVIDGCAGRAIWVPLSGGADSRLVLCKLVELGCDNLRTFTYGPPRNDEARIARAVSQHLGVPWRFVPSTHAATRSFFRSDDRRAYWRFADGLSSVPHPHETMPLRTLMEKGAMRPGDVVINGSTGDFLSGRHIPRSLHAENSAAEDLRRAVIDKHYSLWQSLKTAENVNNICRRVLQETLAEPSEKTSAEELCHAYEQYEFEGRQAKFILNAQRAYEYRGLDWRLPLFDPAFVKFWRDVPVRHKLGQALYRDYLRRYDLKGAFTGFRREVDHWPGLRRLLLLPSYLVRFARGDDAYLGFLKRLQYVGLQGNTYAPYGYRRFLRCADDMRHSIALHALTWLRELGIAAPRVTAFDD